VILTSVGVMAIFRQSATSEKPSLAESKSHAGFRLYLLNNRVKSSRAIESQLG